MIWGHFFPGDSPETILATFWNLSWKHYSKKWSPVQYLLLKVSNMPPALVGICNLKRKLGFGGKYLEIDVTVYGVYRLWLDKTSIKFYSFPTADSKYILEHPSFTVTDITSGRSINFMSFSASSFILDVRKLKSQIQFKTSHTLSCPIQYFSFFTHPSVFFYLFCSGSSYVRVMEEKIWRGRLMWSHIMWLQ